MGRAVIINGTALGAELSGIGVYLLGLLTALTTVRTDIPLIVYLNENARRHVERLVIPSYMTVRWTTRFLSPDYRFFGHILRLLYANALSLRHRTSLCFSGSQLEAMLYKSAQVVMIHDIIPLLVPRGNRKQQLYFRYVLPRAIRRAAAVITPSATVKDQLRSAFGIPGERIHVIPHGIEHAAHRGCESAREGTGRTILFVGRDDPHKNLDRLLQAFERLAGSIDHTLVLVGVDHPGAGRRHRAGAGRIVYKGYVPDAEKAALYRSASLLVFPSLQEGFGFPPLEAMINSCPVVASSAACVPEVCGDAAYYVDPADVDSIAKGMYQVATNAVLRDALIARGLRRAEVFSWMASAEDHLRLFHHYAHEGTALQERARTGQKEYARPYGI